MDPDQARQKVGPDLGVETVLKDYRNSFLASSEFCCLLIAFTNSLDPNQDRQNVGPDLDPNYLTFIVFLKEFFEKVEFGKKSADHNKSMKNYPACKELNIF